MAYSFNFDDPSIIFNNNVPTILEASAGSGKTTILTERWIVCFLYLLVGEEKTVAEALSSIIALTFTKKAAAEMKERIRYRMNQLWINNELPDMILNLSKFHSNINILEAMKILNDQKEEINDLLSLSTITTINGFILQKLKQYPLESGLNSNLSPTEENSRVSNAEIKAQISTLQSLFEHKESKILQKIFTLGISLCGFAQWEKLFQDLRELITQHNENMIYDALENSQYMIFNNQIQNILNTNDSVQKIFDIIYPKLNVLIAALETENAYKPLTKNNKVFYQNLCNFNKDHLLSLFSKDILGEYIFSELKDSEGLQLREISNQKYKEFITCQYQILIPLIIPISQLCSQKLNQIYHEDNQISFSESEYLFLDILKNPLFDQKVCGNMKFLFIDEFQDTSDIQKQIVNKILEHNHIVPFFVGDPKQSIYSFRKANVQVFYDTQREFEKKGFQPKQLKTNYRSGKLYVKLINHLFSEIFANDAQNITYFPQESFRDVPAQFFYTCSEALDTAFIQAVHLLSSEMEQGTNPGNVIILLKRNRDILKFQKVLKKYLPDIPVTSSIKEPLWTSPYIMPLIRFLRVLVMPQDNFLLVSLLKSEFFRKSDPEIDKLIETSLKLNISIYDILENHDKQIITHLASLRDRIPLDELIDQIIKETEYDYVLQLYPNPGEALASMHLFLTEVQMLQQNYSMSVYEFLNYVDQHPDSTDTAEFLGEEGKTLRIMTIHSAKGLEAPCVFYIHENSSLREKFPLFIQDQIAFNVLGKDELGEKLSDLYKKEQLSEQKRLAYVALTRAKEKFYFCGLQSIVKKVEKKSEILHDKTWSTFFNIELIEKFSSLCNKIEDIPEKEPLIPADQERLDQNVTCYYESLKSKADIKQNREIIPQFLSVTQLLDAEFSPKYFQKKYKIKNFDINNYIQELDEGALYSYTLEIGSILHHILQNLDMPPKNEVETYLNLHYPHMKLFFEDILRYAYLYWNSEFYQRVYKNNTLIDKEREVAYLVNHDNNIIIRATVDLFLVSHEKNIITDYKLSIKNKLERYHRQLSYYALLSEYAGYPINELILFDLSEGKDIKLSWCKNTTENFFDQAMQMALKLLA
ncbi:ATP-dependent exoDNAse (exonuclease V) beta subunit (contains helicase and exonuclease domains) [Brevinema andersonii]|uniref:DNA 3'-5' helicase n=1 Tax=Brevinema andersonii TaxID=34097 RepID=A0A1I1DSY9_BREAD|nr:UvrD-helicase domain-containing protein [Brevinema andersonii]SFB78129.1 ATP-dependent exoDNAse (exonuclease V) beta subunit (contains helicase and exonuclease domains) [Brevinema andersonii]